MKRFFALFISLCALALPSRPAFCADTGDQEQNIAILQSDHSMAEKDAACAKLKRIGDAKCVPPLATLLTNEELSHSARYALESMPFPEAETALLEALPKTSGSNQVGLINSLGARRDAKAVPALGQLLSSADTNSACAAAMGLGRIGGRQAAMALQSAWSDSGTGPVHGAEIDGLLACANQSLAHNEDSAALKIFQTLYDSGKTDGTRQAAYCGLIRASGKTSDMLILKGIVGDDGATQGAALQMAAKMEGAGLTMSLADLLPKVKAPVQIALLDCLKRRGDSSSQTAVAQMLNSDDPDVRMAAINALGDLGGGSVVVPLAQKAATATGAEKLAARVALMNLHQGEVTPALLEAFSKVPADVQPELIRALGDRGDASAAPKLLEMARGQDAAMRASALQALALLAGPEQLSEMVQLVVQAPTDDARSEAADALSSVCQRIESRSGHCDVEALAKAVRAGPTEARLALLPVCSGLTEAPVREALRAAVTDADARVKEAAFHAMCDTRDGELLPDLVKAATGTTDEKTKLLAVRGCVRLATQEESVKLSDEQKLADLKQILAQPLDAPEKKLVLSGLGAIASSQSLALAVEMLKDPAVVAEAAQSVNQIADSLAASDPKEASEALEKVRALAADPALQSAAEEVQKKIRKTSGFITQWQVAGPYQQEGKTYVELFDILFAPETLDVSGVHWAPLKASGNGGEPWKMDLLKVFGGEERVAYARTWIESLKKQTVRLELGSDDGIKVWLNGTLVHANNVARAVKEASDNLDVTLDKGWNRMMLKVTQHNAGWGFCVRLSEPSGEPLAGLRASLNPPAAAKR